jgi:hypothetical protein
VCQLAQFTLFILVYLYQSSLIAVSREKWNRDSSDYSQRTASQDLWFSLPSAVADPKDWASLIAILSFNTVMNPISPPAILSWSCNEVFYNRIPSLSSVCNNCFSHSNHISSTSWSFVAQYYFGDGLLILRSTPRREDHPLLPVRDCLFNIFIANTLVL